MTDSMNLENQNLKEVVEAAKQICSGLDIASIIKNVNIALFSKFTCDFTNIVLPKDDDDLTPVFYFYKGLKRGAFEQQLDSLFGLINFFEKQEFNYISFNDFIDLFHDKYIIQIFKNPSPEFIIPIKADKGIIGVYFQGPKADRTPYQVEEIQYCINTISFASIAIENANLYRQATVDQMTKLYTHHQFEKRLTEEIKKGHRYGYKFSLLMFDIDHFKKFNDKFGHLQGDVIIKEISKIFSLSIRDFDFPSRYGGEEFIAILPEIDARSAAKVAERLRKSVESFDFPGDSGPLKITISVGVTDFDPHYVKYNETIVEVVDQALYHSKHHGRNRVSIGFYHKEPEIYK